jgi:hypothetical protein
LGKMLLSATHGFAGSPPGQLHLYLEARLWDMGAGRPVLSLRWRLEGLPASAATENPWGDGGASVSTARLACDASGLERCDGHHKLLFE